MKNAETDPYLCLLGVVMRRGHHDGEATERLSRIKTELFGHSTENPVILHRRDLVRGQPPFDRLRSDPKLRAEFEARWHALISETEFSVIAAAIDKHALRQKYKVYQYDPYHYCLECILERYVKLLSRIGAVGDVIVESRGKHPDKRLKFSYQRFYNNGNSHCNTHLIHSRLTTKELKFTDKSEDVTGIQIADSLAHPTLSFMRTKALGEDRPATYGQRLVDVLIAEKFVRNPYNGATSGWGHKMLP